MSPARPPRAILRSFATRAWLGAQLALNRHGLLWPSALALAMAAAAVHLGIVRPARARQTEARLALQAPAPAPAVPAKPIVAADATEVASLDALAALLRPEEDLDSEVRELYLIAAAARLPIGAAQFSTTIDQESGLRRLAINVAVNGRYVDVREFIDSALVRLPNLSIDEISLSGSRGQQAALDVRVRLSLWGRSQEGLHGTRSVAPSIARGA